MSSRSEYRLIRPVTMAWPWWVPPVAALGIALFFVSGGLPADRALTQWGTWALFVYPIVWVDRRLPVGSDALGRRAAWHIPLSVAWTFVYVLTLLMMGRLPASGEMDQQQPLRQAVAAGVLHWNILNYWLIVGAHFAVDAAQQAQERQRRGLELERQLVEAQLSALRAQLQPHFLFNALNVIAAEVEREPATARAMIAHLGELLRATLRLAMREEVPLHQEVALLEPYLAIQRARFAGRLHVDVRIDPAARDVPVPPLLLQPLVENAMQHGLGQTMRPGRVRIAAVVADGRLRISVEDDGVGLPVGWHDGVQEGTGLTNTRRRLATRYGSAHRFDLRPGSAGGVNAVIDIPAAVVAAVSTSRAE